MAFHQKQFPVILLNTILADYQKALPLFPISLKPSEENKNKETSEESKSILSKYVDVFPETQKGTNSRKTGTI